tara:strand:- start:83 stop:592 length:510 start_codon:yes stop_codon:yes gene_type:complete
MFKWPLITIFLIILLLVINGMAGYLFYFIFKIPEFLKHLLQIITFVLTGVLFKKYLNKKDPLMEGFNKEKNSESPKKLSNKNIDLDSPKTVFLNQPPNILDNVINFVKKILNNIFKNKIIENTLNFFFTFGKNVNAKLEFKKCPYCDEEIKINAKKCKHCGEWLTKIKD